MKKRIVLIIVFLVLVIPIPSGVYKDGGTRVFSALTYKIVDWNRLTGDSTYDKTKVYFFPNNFKSIDGLWYMEEDEVEHSFVATVLEMNGTSVIVEPVDGEEELHSGDQISFGVEKLADIGAEVGSMVQVIYTGGIMESLY